MRHAGNGADGPSTYHLPTIQSGADEQLVPWSGANLDPMFAPSAPGPLNSLRLLVLVAPYKVAMEMYVDVYHPERRACSQSSR